MRFICASNKNPLQEEEEGRFRVDLYYRLHVIPIHLPPLDAEVARSGGSRPANGEGAPLDVEAGGTGLAAGDSTPGGIRALWQVEKDTIKRAPRSARAISSGPPPISASAPRPSTASAWPGKPRAGPEPARVGLIRRRSGCAGCRRRRSPLQRHRPASSTGAGRAAPRRRPACRSGSRRPGSAP